MGVIQVHPVKHPKKGVKQNTKYGGGGEHREIDGDSLMKLFWNFSLRE